ncbi:MAG: hypothetical protein AB7N76_00330 [Planctomycetota bacterium]
MRVPLPAALLGCLLCLGIGFVLHDGGQAPTPAAAPADPVTAPSATPSATGAPGPRAQDPTPSSSPGPSGSPAPSPAPGVATPTPTPGAAAEPGAPSPPLDGRTLALPLLDLDQPGAEAVVAAFATLLHEQGRDGEATALLLTALARAPGKAALHRLLLELDPELGLQHALVAIERAEPGSAAAEELINALADSLPESLAPEQRQRVVAALERQAGPSTYRTLLALDPARAVARFRAVAQGADDASLLQEMALAASELGALDDALTWGLRANELQPDLAPPPVSNDEQARQFEALLQADPRRNGLRVSLIQGYARLGRTELLEARAREWARVLTPDELSEVAWAVADEQQPRAAALFFEHALRASPYDQGTFSALAELDPARAFAIYEELQRDERSALALSPALPQAFSALLTGQKPESVLPQLARHGRRLDPNSLAGLVQEAYFGEHKDLAEKIHAFARGLYPTLPAWSERLRELAGDEEPLPDQPR